MINSDQNQPLADAFYAGADAFKAGLPETANPYSDGKDWLSLQYQWSRGYRNTRKRARFNATIAARRTK
jgi:hypothetical protein